MAITTISEVKKAGGLTSEYEDSEILSEIDAVEAIFYQKYSLPKRSKFIVDTDYTNFYIYPNKVHEITRLQVAVPTSIDISGYIEVESTSITWEHSPSNNFITLYPAFITSYENKTVRVQHIPKIYNLLAKYTVALNLLDTTSIVDGEDIVSTQITRIKDKINEYKLLLKPKNIKYSSNEEEFDKYDYISYTQSELR